MPYEMKAYVEHVAIRVKDIDWHLRFFRDVLGMTIARERGGADGTPRQVWTTGGMQLISDPDFQGPEGRLGHLGVMAEDVEAVLRAAQAWGVRELPQGRTWFALPDGLNVEILQATPGSVAAALAVDPRA
jgi:catechol 2,3-dioxygenase-like lactoylglutathione lyase family enzyme